MIINKYSKMINDLTEEIVKQLTCSANLSQMWQKHFEQHLRLALFGGTSTLSIRLKNI